MAARPIELPFPAKILWPNGRGHRMAKHRAFVKHKSWAYIATLEAAPERPAEHVRLSYTVHPKTRNVIDKDNAIAAMKAYQDGIALALKVDDSIFGTPALEFGEPVKGGKVFVRIEEAA